MFDLIFNSNMFDNLLSFKTFDEMELGPSFKNIDDTHYGISFDTNGVDLSNIDVDVENDEYLNVSYYSENGASSASYSYKIYIPPYLDSSSIRCEYDNDKLTVLVNRL